MSEKIKNNSKKNYFALSSGNGYNTASESTFLTDRYNSLIERDQTTIYVTEDMTLSVPRGLPYGG